MVPHRDAPSAPGHGEGALLWGLVSLLFCFVPVVGDLVAVPAGVAAVVLGLRGFLSQDAVHSSWRFVLGAACGLLSLFVTFLMLAALATPG